VAFGPFDFGVDGSLFELLSDDVILCRLITVFIESGA